MYARFAIVLLALALTGCLEPMRRYRFTGIQGDGPEAVTETVARAFVAADAEPDIVDPKLRMVSTHWQTPYGSSQGSTWTRRWVAVVSDAGEVTVHAELKVCRAFQGCTDLNQQGSSRDAEALAEFAQRLAESLHSKVSVVP